MLGGVGVGGPPCSADNVVFAAAPPKFNTYPLTHTLSPSQQKHKQTQLAETLRATQPCFYGTPLFASCAALRGALPCPRDDVEGLLYSLLSMAASPPPGGNGASTGRANGRRHSRLPFEVVRGAEADGGRWSHAAMDAWAARKERGWAEAARAGRIPEALDHCHRYLAGLGPSDPIDYDLMCALLDGMGRPSAASGAGPAAAAAAAVVTGAMAGRRPAFLEEWPFAGEPAGRPKEAAAVGPKEAAAQLRRPLALVPAAQPQAKRARFAEAERAEE